MNEAENVVILGKEAAAGETIKATGKQAFGHLGGLAAEESLDMRMIEQAFVGVADRGDGLQQDARIHVEEAADLVEDIGAREAFAG